LQTSHINSIFAFNQNIIKMTIKLKIKELEKYQYQKRSMTDLELENLKSQSLDFQNYNKTINKQ